MPKVVAKYPVPACNGQVVLYGSGTSAGKYFYREWIGEEKRYRTHLLTDAATETEAIEQAVKLVFSNSDASVVVRKRRSPTVAIRPTKRPTIEQASLEWVSIAERNLNSGLIAKSTYTHKERTMRLYVVPYLLSKGINRTDALTNQSFGDYLVYRSKTTPLVRQRELSIIKDWVFNYLLPNDYLTQTPSKVWFPEQKIHQTDRLKNPAINPDDWQTIISYVRKDWREHLQRTGHQNHRAYYWRDLFWHYLLFAKNTGMSPEEILKLRWRDVEIKDVGRIDSKGNRQEWLVAYIRTIRSKTKQAREIPTNLGRELRRWMGIIKAYAHTHSLPLPDQSSCVFGNPYYDYKSYSYGMYKQAWVEVRNTLEGKLKGHRFSPHPYTLYSLRATFIENHLLKGTDVFLLARMAGHDVKELLQSYERIDIRQRAKEITKIEFGKTKDEEYLVNLLATDDD